MIRERITSTPSQSPQPPPPLWVLTEPILGGESPGDGQVVDGRPGVRRRRRRRHRELGQRLKLRPHARRRRTRDGRDRREQRQLAARRRVVGGVVEALDGLRGALAAGGGRTGSKGPGQRCM